MTQLQKFIKYLAIAFGFFLIAAMAAAVLGVAGIFAGVSFWQDSLDPEMNAAETVAGPFSGDIMCLEMEIGAADIQILPGDDLRVHTDNPYIVIKEKNGRLVIQEKSHVGSLDSSILTVYAPEETVFEDVDIAAGAGKLTIKTLSCRELNLELGAGMAEIHYLQADKSADIEGGAGQIVIHDGTFHNLNFDMGVGKAEIFAALSGNCEISAGIGNLVLTIPARVEDYTILAESGIGRIEVDGMRITGNGALGSGENRIELEGGIGNIDVYFG